MLELVVCTLSTENSPGMIRMTQKTLNHLEVCNYKLRGVHIGNPKSSLSVRMKHLYGDNLIIENEPSTKNHFKRARLMSEIAMTSLKENFRCAIIDNPSAIVYTEGDKHTFVPSIPLIARPIISHNADLTMAVRSDNGFNKFPLVQMAIEGFVNWNFSKITGIKTDYEYGPRAFSPDVAQLFCDYPRNDWGIFNYPVICAMLEGKRYEGVVVDGSPQPDYMSKYPAMMTFPLAHLAWRAIQNIPILKAGKLAQELYAKR